MTNVTAVLSMLHESPEHNSATRSFRQDPVLSWTLERLSNSQHLGTIAILCWEDQIEAVRPIGQEMDAHILVKGPRQLIPSVESIAAAQKFADGWRAGLQSSCEFDRGFFAPWILEITERLDSDAVLLIDPSSGLVDYEILDAMIQQARAFPEVEIFFTQAAPGLSGALVRKPLLQRLGKVNSHPGQILHYIPDQPARDPIGGDGCVPVPTPVARTLRRFKLDSHRQIERITSAAVSLNGTLVSSSSQELLNRLESHRDADFLPRDITLELTTRRSTKPVFSPLQSHSITRPDLSLESAEQLFSQLGGYDDVRLTLAGVGDPLLSGQLLDIIAAARKSGIDAIHLETDLLADDLSIEQLVDSQIDVVSVHLPAMQTTTYQQIMGVDRLKDVIENIKRFVTHRQLRRRGVPLLVPTFVKLATNLSEMEAWYDQWLRALGSAVIVGPSEFSGQVTGIELADMQPPRRTPCRRLESRLTILSDGSFVACEQDVIGKHPLGNIANDSIEEIWRQRIGGIRKDHFAGEWSKHPLCAGCKEWHRP